MNRRPSPWIQAAFATMVAAAVLFFVDLACVVGRSGLQAPLDKLALQLFVVAMLASAVLVGMGTLVGLLAVRLTRLLDLAPRAATWAPGFLFAFPISLGGVIAIEDVLTEQGFRHRPDAFALRAGIHLLGLAVPWVLARGIFGHYHGPNTKDSGPARGRHLVLLLLLSLALVSTLVLQVKLFPDRYHGFRCAMTVLVLVEAALLGQGLAVFLFGRGGRLLAAAAIVGVGIACHLFRLGSVPSDEPLVRQALFSRTCLSRRLLGLWEWPTSPDSSATQALFAFREEPLDTEWLDRTVPGRKRFNFLLVTLDTVRADRVGAYGFSEHKTTPFLDALAKEATQFVHAYAQYPSSQLSMASYFRGLYPTACDVMTRRGDLAALKEPSPQVSLAELFRQGGHRTLAATSFSSGLLDRGFAFLRQGFDVFDPWPRDTIPDGELVVDQALELLAREREPYFLWLHLFDPHDPWRRRAAHSFGESKEALYAGEIAHADTQLGRVLQALRRQGTWERTVVVVHADHGEALGDHGAEHHGTSLYDEQVRVPLVWRIPGAAPARVDDPVELVDLLPTCRELFGLRPSPTHGQSLLGSILGRAPRGPPSVAFFQLREGALTAPRQDGIRSGRHKLIHDVRFGVDELYDLASDPKELRNLVAELPEVSRHLREILSTWQAFASDSRGLAQAPWENDAQLVARAREAAWPQRSTAISQLLQRGLWLEAALPCAELAAARAAPVSDRLQALRCLLALGDARTAFDLIEIAARADESSEMRLRALVAASAIESAPVEPLLLRLADDSRDPFLSSAARVCQLLRGRKLFPEPTKAQALGEFRIVEHLALARAGQAQSQAIRRSLLETGSPGEELEFLAWRTAAASGTPDAVFAAASRIQTQPTAPEQHQAMVASACALPKPLAFPVLRLHVGDPSPPIREAVDDWFQDPSLPGDLRSTLTTLDQRLAVITMSRGLDRTPSEVADAISQALAVTRLPEGWVDWAGALQAFDALIASGRLDDARRLRRWLGWDARAMPREVEVLLARLETLAASFDPKARGSLELLHRDPMLTPGAWWTAEVLVATKTSLIGGMGAKSVRLVALLARAGSQEPITAQSLPLHIRGVIDGAPAVVLVALKIPPLSPGPHEVRLTLATPERTDLLAPPLTLDFDVR